MFQETGSQAYTDKSYKNDIALGARIDDLKTPEAIRAIFPPGVPTASFEGTSGYLNRDGGWAFAEQGVAQLMRKVQEQGAQIVAGKSVVELIRKDGRTKGVKCADGSTYDAELVVIASGSWTPSSFPTLDLQGNCLATG